MLLNFSVPPEAMMVMGIAVAVLAIAVVAFHRKKRPADDPTDNRVTMTLGERRDE